MGKYLHYFETESAFTDAYNGESYIEPWVSYTDETDGEEHVDYNKITPEQAFAAGNFVRVSYNFNGEETPSGTRYQRDTLCAVDFGPNFDNSLNSVFVSSGELNTNFMKMFTYSGQEFDTNNGYDGFERGEYSYTTTFYYNVSGGWTEFLNSCTPILTGEGTSYKCAYDADTNRWYAFWNGRLS